jgi:hypothetical protein
LIRLALRDELLEIIESDEAILEVLLNMHQEYVVAVQGGKVGEELFLIGALNLEKVQNYKRMIDGSSFRCRKLYDNLHC